MPKRPSIDICLTQLKGRVELICYSWDIELQSWKDSFERVKCVFIISTLWLLAPVSCSSTNVLGAGGGALAVSTVGLPQTCLAPSGLPAHALLSSWKESSHFCLANSSSFFKPQGKAKLFFSAKLFLALPGSLRGSFYYIPTLS